MAYQTVVFDRGGTFTWDVPAGNETLRLGGIILDNNTKLELEKNGGNHMAFDIQNGCITIKSGSSLEFGYISGLKNVEICVEDNAELIFDGDKNRETFTFDGVKINLMGDNAKLKFDIAEIDIKNGGLVIDGWTGDGYCSDPNDDDTAPTEGESGNISWSSGTKNICSLLNINVLPVEWHQVSAKYAPFSRSNTVNWSTLKEWENSHFEIERSIDGVKDYKKIGRVEGMGWSDDLTVYSFCDEDLPLRGGRVYYRIKQVDFEGTFDYSQTMMVNVPGVQVTKGEWRAYPNPIRGNKFNIVRLATESLRSDIQVKVMTSQIPVATFTAKSEVELNSHVQKLLPRIPKGVFVVELQSNQQIEYLKVIKD
ncbi:hypothetical protein KIH41_01900 [Litoribacter ruber]|uniref:hypothetical protein n=1 Tax=Litoribacter ruber TaxID=702568 RepID=UPI001BD928C1|nr:hypothetical protein [Litoribacter ruber]MBT0810031.1 hypothetical protein [Litoribacter ruber]